jgi:hypothetical protein
LIQLFNPFWLIALAGLIVPIAIHFWNRKPGRTLKVGSIRWLQEAASQRMSSIRLHDLWLLLLRMTVLSLLVLLLTQPRWLQAKEAARLKWVLVSPDVWQTESRSQIKGWVDSLRAQSFVLKSFSRDFPAISDQEWAAPVRSTSSQPASSYWSLLERLNQLQPAPAEVYLITGNQERHFSGERPEVTFPVTWITVPSTERSQWLYEAFRTQSDSLEIHWAESQATGTRYRTLRTGFPEQNTVITQAGFPEMRFIRNEKGAYLEAEGEYASQVSVQEVAQRLVIYASANRREDVRYLKAALQTWLEYSRRKYKLTITESRPKMPLQADWLFWLAEEDVPETLLQEMNQGMNIFRDSPTNEKVYTEPVQMLIPGTAALINIYRQDTTVQAGVPIWKSNFGRSLLTFQPNGGGGWYQFSGRFHPNWNDLPKSPSFPQVMGSVLHPDTLRQTHQRDVRIIEERQIQPIRVSSTEQEPLAQPAFTDLRKMIGLLVLLLFGLERYFAQKRHKTVNYTSKRTEAA